MKALIFKEFKLAMHPICYFFILFFPLMMLIPSYPIGIAFIYVLTCYPILFLGANKGQQSNDLLFSTMLPVRKKDIVFARMITLLIIQISFIALCSALAPVGNIISEGIKNDAIANGGQYEGIPGIPYSGFVSLISFVLIGFAISDIIYLPIYYKKGKSIVLSTLLTILFFAIYISFFTIIFPYIDAFKGLNNILFYNGVVPQLIFLLISIAIYVGIHFLAYVISSRRLEKVDF